MAKCKSSLCKDTDKCPDTNFWFKTRPNSSMKFFGDNGTKFVEVNQVQRMSCGMKQGENWGQIVTEGVRWNTNPPDAINFEGV